MDFSYMGGNEWGTDQILPSTPMNFNDSDIFMTQPVIDKQLRWPTPKHQYPHPEMQAKSTLPTNQSNVEGFTDNYGGYPQITENMLIILLLVILIVMCTMIYSTVKQTCEAIKLMTSILASRSNP
jgi:hypothetical protein